MANEQPYGLADRVDQLVHRLLAPNPSPFTYSGTQTYLVGDRDVAVIDPGPDEPAHVEALVRALDGKRLVAILCTHTHRDHSPASRALRSATGAPIIGCAPLVLDDSGPRSDAAFDRDYLPEQVLADGDTIGAEGWVLTAVATPGHTSNHLCYALNDGEALFTGDHVMGWSTTVVAPPDGDMAAYMDSLDKLIARADAVYHPAHGDAVRQPRRFVGKLRAHRVQRETQILHQIGSGNTAIPAMVAHMYKDVDPRLHTAAGMSVLAHLIDLEARGKVSREGESWRIAA